MKFLINQPNKSKISEILINKGRAITIKVQVTFGHSVVQKQTANTKLVNSLRKLHISDAFYRFCSFRKPF